MKILTNYDFNQNQILNIVLQKLATPPTSPVSGQIYYNTVSNRAFTFNGKEWIGADAIGSSMTGEGIVNAINGSDFIINNLNLSQEVRDAIDKSHNTHSVSDITGLSNLLEGKANASDVLTPVPSMAKFTDTITSINGKTGVITKDDIVALGIPSEGEKYTLPVAKDGVLGGVKSGTGIRVDEEGNVTVDQYGHSHSIGYILGLQTILDEKETIVGSTAKASVAEDNAKKYTNSKIAELVGSAPEVLDTLHEISMALDNDPNFATTITRELGNKADKFSQQIGDGEAKSFVLNHGHGSRDIVVMLRESAAPYAQVITDVEMTTTDTVTVKFAVAPKVNEYTITIIG